MLSDLPTTPPEHPGFNLKTPKSPTTSTSADLKVVALKDLDLEAELAEQYARAKKLFTDVAHDDDTPTNQKAQVLNTIQGILQSVIKMYQEVYNVERMKALEDTLITVLKDFPDVKVAFLDAYSAAITAAQSKLESK